MAMTTALSPESRRSIPIAQIASWTSRPERVRENADVFGFTLTDDEMDRITALDREDGRVGPDPREMNAGTPVGDA